MSDREAKMREIERIISLLRTHDIEAEKLSWLLSELKKADERIKDLEMAARIEEQEAEDLREMPKGDSK